MLFFHVVSKTHYRVLILKHVCLSSLSEFYFVSIRKLAFHLIPAAELLSMKDSKPASPGEALLFLPLFSL